MFVATLDQHQRALEQLDALAVHDRYAGPGDDVEPLVRALVAVVPTALGLSRCERHLGGLAVVVSQHDAEPVAKLQVPVLHGYPHSSGLPPVTATVAPEM